jgi:hypothetical protein
MKYNVTVQVEADDAVSAIDVVTGSDFYYTDYTVISATTVKEEL